MQWKAGIVCITTVMSVITLLGSAAGAPSLAPIPVVVTFNSAYDITGDGEYRHGVDGVRAEINLNSGDLLFDTRDSGSRTVTFNLPGLPPTCEVAQTTSNLFLSEKVWMNINELYRVPAGGSMDTGLVFLTSAGYLRFRTRLNPYCSLPVTAYRSSDGDTWVIQTGGEPRAVLTQFVRGKERPIGYFSPRLQITVTVKR